MSENDAGAPAPDPPAGAAEDPGGSTVADLRHRLRQLAQPLVDTLDARLAAQVDRRVTERVDALLRDRLAVIERAIADLDRAIADLEARLGE
ncbi:MAG TPA: hypothetical protein PLS29_10680 [Acidimicrobiales bacterium]|nr:MAG: hypothetical protein B7Z69_08845 [Actinobacteria bacterium 21-73-9]HQU27479.1 hypothetical protein [Acidimicrobiales bacterium]